MARSVLRLNESERDIFYANYCYMWKKLNTAPYYVCGYGQQPDYINAAWLLPSYANLSKCLNPSFIPSMNIVNKIVQFYNANILPSVDTYVFLHEKLEDSDTKRSTDSSEELKELLGLYYGYYYAGIEDEQHIYGAVIKIYDDASSVSACMIAGLSDDDVLNNRKINDLLATKEIKSDAYKEFVKNLPLSQRRTTIYKGPVTYTPGLMTLALKDADKGDNYLHIRIPVTKAIDDRYLGGLGVITMVSENFDIQFLKIGTERADDSELIPLSLRDDKLSELLKIKKAANEHIYMGPSDNKRWTDYLINTASRV